VLREELSLIVGVRRQKGQNFFRTLRCE
jgi:hypothetical protein